MVKHYIWSSGVNSNAIRLFHLLSSARPLRTQISTCDPFSHFQLGLIEMQILKNNQILQPTVDGASAATKSDRRRLQQQQPDSQPPPHGSPLLGIESWANLRSESIFSLPVPSRYGYELYSTPFLSRETLGRVTRARVSCCPIGTRSRFPPDPNYIVLPRLSAS